MANNKKIDIQRESAITLKVGGDDDESMAKEILSTGNSLYIIKEEGVYKIQLADDIDPNRENINIPNLNQRVLTSGHSNETVARILLTSKYLFDRKNATVEPFVADLFEKSIILTKKLLELDSMVNNLVDEINQKEKTFAERFTEINAVTLPSIPDMDTRVHNILSIADKAKDMLLRICSLHFLPNINGKPKLTVLENAIVESLSSNSELITVWKETAKYFSLIRNARNASEHSNDKHKVVLDDFSMWPDGNVYPPFIEIQHADTPIRQLPLIEFLEFIKNSMLDNSEAMLIFIKFAALTQHNPLGEWVVEFSEEKRKHKFVRYYRAIKVGEDWRILG